MPNLTNAQRNVLLRPIDGWRVMEKEGQSHLAAFDVIAHLNRVFGFEGWDKEILSLELVYEHVGQREVNHARDCKRQPDCRCRNAKTVAAVSVGYRCTLRLTLRNPDGEVVRVVEDAAMGTATNQRDMGDAHDLAVKSAVSYALKRCAKDLGDQFGLSLYNKGQESAVVMRVFPYGDDGPIEGEVHADGIEEGDSGFGSDRGEGEVQVQHDPEPEAQEDHPPVEDGDPGGTHPVHEPEPVREPEPAKPEKPEPTPPEPKAETPPPVDTDACAEWVEEIGKATDVDKVKTIWRSIQNLGHLDVLVTDPAEEGKPITLRELMVRRVDEIGDAA